MSVAAIYDIHGNLPALEAVLHEIRLADVERIVVGGDVLPGPMPRETLQCLLDLDLPVQFLMGNGDREVLAQIAGTETDWYRTAPAQWRDPVGWTARKLSPEQAQTISGWPATCRLVIPGIGDVLFCHATPRNDTEVFTRLTPDEWLRPVFQGVESNVVVCGHTHMQFDRTVGGIRVVNAGSVGMPYGEPGAYWLLLGPNVAFRRTVYDLKQAAERIGATEYPKAQEFAARHVQNPPTEEEILKALAGAELR